MSKQPLGKTLLKNVIRQTDAHNKIQEQIEMWKMRSWEIQRTQNKQLSDSECMRGQMHCDRVSGPTRGLSHSRESVSEHDDREARYWTRKLYEYEAKDSDRWGHSGFKELYPEEFESDSEKASGTKKIGRHKKSDIESSLSKRSKKSLRKKKKKKKKKDEEGKRKKAKCPRSDDSDNDSSDAKDKPKRKRNKSGHKVKKAEKSTVRDDSSSESSEDEVQRERRTRRHKKRKRDSHRGSEPGPKKKRKKDWKAVCEQNSSDRSTD